MESALSASGIKDTRLVIQSKQYTLPSIGANAEVSFSITWDTPFGNALYVAACDCGNDNINIAKVAQTANAMNLYVKNFWGGEFTNVVFTAYAIGYVAR